MNDAHDPPGVPTHADPFSVEQIELVTREWRAKCARLASERDAFRDALCNIRECAPNHWSLPFEDAPMPLTEYIDLMLDAAYPPDARRTELAKHARSGVLGTPTPSADQLARIAADIETANREWHAAASERETLRTAVQRLRGALYSVRSAADMRRYVVIDSVVAQALRDTAHLRVHTDASEPNAPVRGASAEEPTP